MPKKKAVVTGDTVKDVECVVDPGATAETAEEANRSKSFSKISKNMLGTPLFVFKKVVTKHGLTYRAGQRSGHCVAKACSRTRLHRRRIQRQSWPLGFSSVSMMSRVGT